MEKDQNTSVHKKRKKQTKTLITIIYTLIGTAVAFWIGYTFGRSRGERVYPDYMLLKALLTLFITGFIQINIHEFGHFVMGKLLGYQLVFYQIGFLSFMYENGKMKFSIQKNRGFSGACGMYPPKEGVTPMRQVWYFAGGLIFNALSLIPILLVMNSTNNDTVTILGEYVILSTIVLIVMNAVPFSVGSQPNDGKIIFSTLFKSPMTKHLIESFYIASQLSQGIRPGDLNIEDFDDEKLSEVDSVVLLQLVVMRYYKALDKMDLVNMKRYIPVIEEQVKSAPSYMQPPLYYELIYYYSVLESNYEKAEGFFACIKQILLKDKDVNGKRILSAYEYYVKADKESALRSCKEGLEVVDKYPLKGQALMEKKLLEELLGALTLES